jgi:hypothetical protein
LRQLRLRETQSRQPALPDRTVALIATIPYDQALSVDGIPGVRLGKRRCGKQRQEHEESLHD